MHINDLSCLFSSLWCRAQKPWDSGPQTPTLLLWGITAFMPDKTNQIKRKKCPSNPGILTAGCKRVFAFPWSDALKTAHFPIKGPMIFASCERWLMCSTLSGSAFYSPSLLRPGLSEPPSCGKGNIPKAGRGAWAPRCHGVDAVICHSSALLSLVLTVTGSISGGVLSLHRCNNRFITLVIFILTNAERKAWPR